MGRIDVAEREILTIENSPVGREKMRRQWDLQDPRSFSCVVSIVHRAWKAPVLVGR